MYMYVPTHVNAAPYITCLAIEQVNAMKFVAVGYTGVFFFCFNPTRTLRMNRAPRIPFTRFFFNLSTSEGTM